MPAFIDRLANLRYMPNARTWLLWSLGALLLFSLIMVLSASIPFAMSKDLEPLRFFISQATYMMLAIVAGW